VKDVVEEALEALHATVQAAKVQALKHVSLAEQETEEEEKEGLSEGEVAQELLSKIEEGMARGQAQVEEMYVIQFLREKLLSSVCQNQGFVLDNFPDTYARARDLFINTTDSREGHNGNAVRQEEGDEELAAKGDFSSKTIPGQTSTLASIISSLHIFHSKV
jgi:adenylate kinase family enzyme